MRQFYLILLMTGQIPFLDFQQNYIPPPPNSPIQPVRLESAEISLTEEEKRKRRWAEIQANISAQREQVAHRKLVAQQMLQMVNSPSGKQQLFDEIQKKHLNYSKALGNLQYISSYMEGLEIQFGQIQENIFRQTLNIMITPELGNYLEAIQKTHLAKIQAAGHLREQVKQHVAMLKLDIETTNDIYVNYVCTNIRTQEAPPSLYGPNCFPTEKELQEWSTRFFPNGIDTTTSVPLDNIYLYPSAKLL